MNFNIAKMNVDGAMRASEWNKTVDAIRSLRIIQSRGVRPEITRSGTLLNITDARAAAQSGSNLGPWDLSSSPETPTNPEDEVSEYNIKVSPGLMNTTLASNWDEEFTIDADTLFFASVKVSTDGEVTTAVEIVISTTDPSATPPTAVADPYKIPSTKKVLFGIGYNSAVQRVIPAGNITLQPRIWLVSQVNPQASAGESPYDIFYELQ
jgi:hypothetical protein